MPKALNRVQPYYMYYLDQKTYSCFTTSGRAQFLLLRRKIADDA